MPVPSFVTVFRAIMSSFMLRILAASAFATALAAAPAAAEKKYDPGATDTEIKIGNIVPYTGPYSEYGAEGRAEAACFRMINDRGGINGRKITFISVDGGTAGKAVALARKLVEEDGVLLIFGAFGTESNTTCSIGRWLGSASSQRRGTSRPSRK